MYTSTHKECIYLVNQGLKLIKTYFYKIKNKEKQYNISNFSTN